MKTQVAIIGAGPAGLLLGHLLYRAGIDTIILENRNEPFLRRNFKGGMIEAAIAEFLINNGVGERLQKEGIKVEVINFQTNGQMYPLVLESKAGKYPILYNQHDIIGDLIDQRKANGQPLIFEGKGQRYEGLQTPTTTIHYTLNAALHRLTCEFVIGCDGFTGISRQVIPRNIRKEVSVDLPYAWLDLLIDAEPTSNQPIYAYHSAGFAMQTPTSDGKTRFHLQIERGTEVDDLPSMDELWNQLEIRLNIIPNRGKVLQRKLDYMRHYHTQIWQHEHLYIAGDAAHFVERTGSKGLNMAFADAIYLAEALIQFYKKGAKKPLNNYSQRCLERTLKIKEFTHWFTKLLHPLPSQSKVEKAQQAQSILAQLEHKTAKHKLINQLVGLPL